MIYASSLDISSIVSFFLGMLAGFTFLLVGILIVMARGKKETNKIFSTDKEVIDKEKIDEFIKLKQETFINEVEENDKDYLPTVMSLSKELIHEISSYYYPESKYPEYELTVTEASELIKYVVDQVVGFFDKPLLKKLKNIKISFIVNAITSTKKVTDSKAVKAVTDSGATEAYGTLKTITNALNPVYWFRKVVVQGSLNIAIKKVCKAELMVLGSELNKIYSKNLFKDDEAFLDNQKQIDEMFKEEL